MPGRKIIRHLYIINCRGGSYYTGITADIAQHLRDHNRGKRSRYTKYRRPVNMLYSESHPDRSSAQKREAQIQGWSRQKKEEILGLLKPPHR